MAAPETPLDDWPEFSRALELRRRAAGMSKAALAQAMGVSPERVRQWRNRPDARPSAEAVERGAAALGCEPGDLWPGWDDGTLLRSTSRTRAPTMDERVARLEAELADLRATIDALTESQAAPTAPSPADLDAAHATAARLRREALPAADSPTASPRPR